nr:hypothetical protein [Streptomyces roseicoloratus]
MSPARLRGLGLGAAVLVAVLVPVAASAGPAGDPGRDSAAAGGDGEAAAGAAAAAGSGDAKGKGLLPDLGLGTARRTTEAGTPPDADTGEPRAVTRCGPELASPDGVEAQTCVVTEGAEAWGRTYYRNTTGQELDAVLTLMAPAGRTVQVRCAVEARDEPGTCETPKEPVRGGAASGGEGADGGGVDGGGVGGGGSGAGGSGAFSAVAEFAGAGEGGNTPLLLRAGSNGRDPEGS